MKDRAQYVNKHDGNNIYTEANWENINNDYYEAQKRLYDSQLQRIKMIQGIVEKYSKADKPSIPSFIYKVQEQICILERYEEIKYNNSMKHHAIGYFVGQNNDNKLIPDGIIFS